MRFTRRHLTGLAAAAPIALALSSGAFAADPPEIVTIASRSRAPSARDAAIAFCQGTPLRGEIEERMPDGLEAATDRATAALVKQIGTGPIDAKIQAHVIRIDR